jgi:hypothetical protein
MIHKKAVKPKLVVLTTLIPSTMTTGRYHVRTLICRDVLLVVPKGLSRDFPTTLK